MILNAIAEIVAKRTGCNAASVNPESHFEDFGLDSLDTMEVLFQLESELGKEIELDDRIDTVADLIKLIESQVPECRTGGVNFSRQASDPLPVRTSPLFFTEGLRF